MQETRDAVSSLLGLEADTLTAWQMAARAPVVYVAALAMVRLGEKRFLGKSTAFDVILAIILGSVVSRAITGSSPFFATLGAGVVLVGLHWLLAVATFHSDRFGVLVKGTPRELVRDGRILWDGMRKSHVGERDLLGALRANGRLEDPVDVRVARLERDGDISVIERERGPRVVEVAVAEGVQTVRIELS